ncbi:Zinc finger protein 710, partial [Frankliniella fusca]
MAKEHVCPTCGHVFDRPGKLARHCASHAKVSYRCEVCGKEISNKANYKRHLEIHENKIKCDVCDLTFSKGVLLRRHLAKVHGPSFKDRRLKCPKCKYLTKSRRRLYTHVAKIHGVNRLCDYCLAGFRTARKIGIFRSVDVTPWGVGAGVATQVPALKPGGAGPGGDPARGEGPAGAAPEGAAGAGRENAVVRGSWDEPTFSLRGAAQIVRYHPNDGERDLGMSLIMNKRELTEKLRSEVQLARGIKWSISASVEVSREKAQNGEPVIESETKTLVSATRELLRESGAEGSQLEESFLDLLNNAETLKMEGSNWMVTNIFYYEFNFALYKPLTGGSYLKTPEWLARKGTILNVKTKNNNQCFRLSILAALHPALRRASDPKTYTPNYNSLNFENIQSENMQIKDLPKFCNLNQDFSLSVIGVEKKDLFPLFCSKERKAVHITLLLLIKGTKRHFVLCRSLDTLLYSQNRHRGRKHFCCFCFNPHATLDARVAHERECRTHSAQRIKYPKEGSYMEFGLRHVKCMAPVQFTIFYDFETLAHPVFVDRTGGAAGRTTKSSEHRPYSYALLAVDFKGAPVDQPVVYACGNERQLVRHFLDSLFKLEELCFSKRLNYPLRASAQQTEEYDKATGCYICLNPFDQTDPSLVKVRDHNPLIQVDNLIGAACSRCNLARRAAHFIPCVAANSSKFDMHLILKFASSHKKFKKCNIHILPRNLEVYRVLSLRINPEQQREIRFIDSTNHYNASLADLAKSLREEDMGLLHILFPEKRKRDLLMQKAHFCYEFCTSFDKIVNQTTLPPIDAFYNRLRERGLTPEEYSEARAVWDAFECQNLLQYSNLYNLLDVLLLASFWMRYRDVTAARFSYEVAHFCSAPGLAMACALKYTRCRVQLLSDSTMSLLFERSIRGGQSYAALRYASANVKGQPSYDPDEPERHIRYFDVNALYSLCLSQDLPQGGFAWLSGEDCENTDLVALHASGRGALLEVDLQYGINMGEDSIHADWPLAPTHMCPQETWYSEYQARIAHDSGLPGSNKVKKLMSFVGPRKNYVLHSDLLLFYLEKGMRVTKYHRGIVYRKSPWLRPFIQFVMNERRNAAHEFESNYLKLICNAVYGYLNRQPRRDRLVKLCQKRQEFLKLSRLPTYKGFRIFSKRLSAVETLKKTVLLSQPISAASCVLDLSKLYMTSLYWELKSHFISQPGKDCELIGTDTDSAIVLLTTDALEEDLRHLSYIFDFSSLPKWHSLYDSSRARAPGFLKVELGSCEILEAVFLKSKCYALRYVPLMQDPQSGAETPPK